MFRVPTESDGKFLNWFLTIVPAKVSKNSSLTPDLLECVGSVLRNSRADVVPHLPYSLSLVLCCCLEEKRHSWRERLQQHGVTQTDVSWWHPATSPARFPLKKHTHAWLYLFSVTHSKASCVAREPLQKILLDTHAAKTHTQMALVSLMPTVKVVLDE